MSAFFNVQKETYQKLAQGMRAAGRNGREKMKETRFEKSWRRAERKKNLLIDDLRVLN